MIFGANSRRYKDVYDMYYLKDIADEVKMCSIIQNLICDDPDMRESSKADIAKRISETFADEQYLKRTSGSRQRWVDDDIHDIAEGIVEYISSLELR